ncbi:MAG: hypothetical protein ACMUIL_03285 [bacterium]
MSREINTDDGYMSRLLKNIPSEVIATYLALEGLFKSKTLGFDIRIPLWITFGLLVCATPLWLIFVQKVRMIRQNIIAALSFVIWVLAMGGPFATIEGYDTLIGSALLILCTIIVFPLVTRSFGS